MYRIVEEEADPQIIEANETNETNETNESNIDDCQESNQLILALLAIDCWLMLVYAMYPITIARSTSASSSTDKNITSSNYFDSLVISIAMPSLGIVLFINFLSCLRKRLGY